MSRKGRLGKKGITLYKRFIKKVQPPSDNGIEQCWIWTGTRGGRGRRPSAQGKRYHGQLYVDGKRVGAHIVAYEMYWGKVPSGLNVLHICDVYECVNPLHLIVGTQKENMEDASQKERMGKLKRADKEEIIKSSESAKILAARYGVTNTTINTVRRLARRGDV